MDLNELGDPGHARHPWEVARREFFIETLLHNFPGSNDISILDVGAGDGWFSRGLYDALKPKVRLVCWDLNYTKAQQQMFRDTADQKIEFVDTVPDEKFDGLLMLDVLEHIENDVVFLQRLVEMNLKSNGFILMSVPAWPRLYSSHDHNLRHFRRYSPRHAKSLLTGGGLEILSSGGLYHLPMLQRFYHVCLEKIGLMPDLKGVASNWSAGIVITNLVVAVLRVENRLSMFFSRAGLSVPGLSWWAICRKNS